MVSYIHSNDIRKEKIRIAVGACLLAVNILIAVSDVQKEVFLMMLLKQMDTVSRNTCGARLMPK
jgi:hypothetical protein